MVDRANIVERGVTLKQIEREHAEVFTFEPFMTELWVEYFYIPEEEQDKEVSHSESFARCAHYFTQCAHCFTLN